MLCYNRSRKKSDGDDTDVRLTVGIGDRTWIIIEIGANGGAYRLELAITEGKPALVNGRWAVANVADDVDHKVRLVRKAKHGQLELWIVVSHADR